MREKDYLAQRYAAILSSVGLIQLLAGALMLTPLGLLFFYPTQAAHIPAFVLPASALALLGALLWRGFRHAGDVTLSVQEGGIIVLVGWVVVILFSAWPFAAILEVSFSRALFEAVSGWTTTGLSVVDVTRSGPLILFWRSLTQLAGGAGLAIIMMSAIVGPSGVGISSAEGRSDQLLPQVRQSARLVLVIYGCYAACGALAYVLAGMAPFDAVNHAFTAVSTGGFSTRPGSLGDWGPAVQAVSVPLMLLGNFSFVTAWFLWRGQLRTVARNGEFRFVAVTVPLAAAVLFFLSCRAIYPELDRSLQAAVFETVTALTTTGFSTVDYRSWNASGVWLQIVLMLVGGGTCSTAGGIKQFRAYLLGKQLFWEFKRLLLPRTAVVECPIWEGPHRVFVDDARLRQVSVFVALYLATYGGGVLLLCACGFRLPDALFEFASALGTVGLSSGITAAHMPDAVLWAEMLAMFLGRLEFVVVIVSVLKLLKDGRAILAAGV